MYGSYTERKKESIKLEERVKYFINNQSSKLYFKNKKLTRPIDENFNTVLDAYAMVGKTRNESRNKNKNTNNNNINLNNKKTNDSSLSTQSQLNSLENKTSNAKNNYSNKNNNSNNYTNNNYNNNQLTKSNCFIVNKDLGKYGEPKLKINEFLKLAPKFSQNLNSSLGESTYFKGDHNLTLSELEILKTDEKVPQTKLEQFEKISENNEFNNKLSIDNITNVVNNPKLFNFLYNQEKCYQELSQDFKINGIYNIDYKLKVAGSYLNILIDDENPLSDIIFNDVGLADINSFFIKELCFYLCILFLNDLSKKMNEDNIKDITACESYCRINFLYAIKFFLDNKEINTEDYQKCEMLIEINEKKLNFNKYKENFHINNKIIKNILHKLLLNLLDINEGIINNILSIFNQSKKNKLKNIIFTFIKNNELITKKINTIINESQLNKNTNNEWDIDEDNPKSIQNPSVPYLPPKKKNDDREYCLVLDLDETLVHYFEDEAEAYVKVRMGAENFITVLSKYCEIVIFTASTQYYADIVVNGLDCKDLIDYKLYREHTNDYNGINIKDLAKLGRDMSKIIIIDNIEDNYLLQKENGLNISDFEGNENDNELQYLLDDLLEVVTQKGLDVREKLPKIRKKMQQRYANF